MQNLSPPLFLPAFFFFFFFLWKGLYFRRPILSKRYIPSFFSPPFSWLELRLFDPLFPRAGFRDFPFPSPDIPASNIGPPVFSPSVQNGKHTWFFPWIPSFFYGCTGLRMLVLPSSFPLPLPANTPLRCMNQGAYALPPFFQSTIPFFFFLHRKGVARMSSHRCRKLGDGPPPPPFF